MEQTAMRVIKTVELNGQIYNIIHDGYEVAARNLDAKNVVRAFTTGNGYCFSNRPYSYEDVQNIPALAKIVHAAITHLRSGKTK